MTDQLPTNGTPTGEPVAPVSFKVDTHVFRELGAFLVGRDSTALAELIKNSYDADATNVFVSGTNLSDPDNSRIVVLDDGIGMNIREFQSGFLTLASRTKSGGERHTRVFGRRYTGAKGIGRLAAHKLARVLTVDSLPDPNAPGHALDEGVHAELDWDAIESVEHVDLIGPLLVVERSMNPVSADADRPWGTRVSLRKLRRAWNQSDIEDFVREVQGYEPPEAVTAPNPDGDSYRSPLLSKGVRVRGATGKHAHPLGRRNRFNIQLDGEFASGEAWTPLADDAAQYVLEIDSNARGVTYGVSRTVAFEKTLPDALRTPIDPVRIAPSKHNIHFQARIFMRAGQSARWDRKASGVRVYLEGFRVLPYGELGNDWLGTDAQYVQRGRELVSLSDRFSDSALFGTEAKEEGLRTLPATGYIGGVFLTEDASGGLQMLVNREGFLPGPAYDELVLLVRRGIDLSTRVRAKDAAAKSRTGRPNVNPVTRERSAALAEQVTELRKLTATLSGTPAATDSASVLAAVASVTVVATEVADTTSDLLDELNMIRVLASVGTQLTAFVHELNGLLIVAQRLQRDISAAPATESGVDAHTLRLLDELRRGLERQASFLVDVTSVDARRRRSAQRVADRVNATVALLSETAMRRAVDLSVNIDADIRTRPMFRAELMAILTNLITNAIRAATPEPVLRLHRDPHQPSDFAGKHGIVEVDAFEADDGVVIQISNTGSAVDVEDAERWFAPYASTSMDADPVLGQGTGLGLTITRALVAENAGTVRFVEPAPPFATAIAVTLPHKRARQRAAISGG